MLKIKIGFMVMLMVFVFSLTLAVAETITLSLGQTNIELDSPFTITNASMYRDGGTIAIIIRDAKGIELPICLDARIKVPQDSRYLYAQTTYPSDPSKKVTPGSDTEKSILSILKSAQIVSSDKQEAERLVKKAIEKLENR